MADKKIYNNWNQMMQRCYNPKCHAYSRYHGRGIKVVNRWLEYENFYKDMIKTYKEGLSIERINNNGNYSPENCKWATKKEQANNRRSSRLINFMGKRKTLSQWVEIFNLKRSTVAQRYYVYQWDIEKCFFGKRGYHFG